MARHLAGCCCDCIETGAMCITVDQQELQRGCYENVTAAEAENDNGIWLGAGTDCENVSGAGCPECGDNAATGITRKKCCYQERTKTGCNEFEVDNCSEYKSEMLTKCECEMREGEWGLNKCPCVNQNQGCSGCCPPNTLPAGTTGAIQVMIGIYFREDYVLNWAGCTPTGGDCECTVQDYHYSEQPVYMLATEYAAFVANMNNNDYDNTCNPPSNCGNGCPVSYHDVRTTTIVGVYTSDCWCGDSDPRCGMCVCEMHFYQSEDGALDSRCTQGHWENGGEGYTCCDDTPQGA